MRTSSAPTIRLKNYAPPAYSVTEVKLDFQLEAKKAHVRCEMLVRRMADTASDAPLVLDGDELNLHALKINGEAPDKASFKASPSKLAISQLPSDETFTVEIETVLNPAANTKLMGLYQSNGVFCTQCEAEGFRRITYFLDRPDVLAVYTVRVEADKSLCKHLLSNGNMVEAGPAEGNKLVRHIYNRQSSRRRAQHLCRKRQGPAC